MSGKKMKRQRGNIRTHQFQPPPKVQMRVRTSVVGAPPVEGSETEYHTAADPERPVQASQVVPFRDERCGVCDGAGMLTAIVNGSRQVRPCHCALQRFWVAHGFHVVKSRGQFYWRKDYRAPGQPTLEIREEGKPPLQVTQLPMVEREFPPLEAIDPTIHDPEKK